MSGLEIAIPILSAVFALVTAFKDGGELAKKIKHRRAHRGATLPDSQLEEELFDGANDVEKLRQKGEQRFGPVYLGDSETASRLKDVIISLQDTIIKQLSVAFENDEVDDFAPVINSAISARIEAVQILNEHYLKLQRQQQQDAGTLHAERGPTPTSPMLERNWVPASQDRAVTPEGPGHGVKRSGTWRLFHRRSSLEPASKQLPSPPVSGQASPSELPGQPLHFPHRQSQASISLPSPMIREMNPSLFSAESIPIASYISERNKYAGLCKCAYYAQKLELNNAMKVSMKNYEWMHHCTSRKCKFQLSADTDQKGNPTFNDRRHTINSIEFRFLFLWKSHIATRDCTVRRYKCLICILTGRLSEIFSGEDHLLGHLCRHENESLIFVSGSIQFSHTGIEAADDASFDVRFPQSAVRRESMASTPLLSLPQAGLARVSRDDERRLAGDLYENGWLES